MSRRTSARLASKPGGQKRPLDPDDTFTDDDTPIVTATEWDDEYIPHNSRKKVSIPPKKKAKVPPKFDPTLLPNELLHSIFQHCEPKMLGKLMRVCKKFECRVGLEILRYRILSCRVGTKVNVRHDPHDSQPCACIYMLQLHIADLDLTRLPLTMRACVFFVARQVP